MTQIQTKQNGKFVIEIRVVLNRCVCVCACSGSVSAPVLKQF